MEIRKIFKTGNSLVLSLPAKLLKEAGLAEGDHVSVAIEDRGSKEIVIKSLKVTVGGETDNSLDDFVKNYGEALDQLEENDTADR